VGKPLGKNPLVRPRRWEDNITTDLWKKVVRTAYGWKLLKIVFNGGLPVMNLRVLPPQC
jgi:hypothetical protein